MFFELIQHLFWDDLACCVENIVRRIWGLIWVLNLLDLLSILFYIEYPMVGIAQLG